ncbi:hypothetical protein E2C01_027210 [Portunus trituberculatus]|uniref:Uncharacterized protein n=1 Tax=Portunus trituberculatus TaxID=210409 RepID=A0A5B7EN49_PORTR|nr:hypothetical protein [Portunus trituberculatus]
MMEDREGGEGAVASWIHAAPFDSTRSVKPGLGLLEVKSRSRPQPVNTTPLGVSWDQPSPSTSPLRHRDYPVGTHIPRRPWPITAKTIDQPPPHTHTPMR